MALGNPDRPIGGLAVRPPPGVELRPLGRDDFEVVVPMLRALHPDATRAHDNRALRQSFDLFIGGVDSVAFLAEAEGEPAGIVAIRFRRRLNWATYEGWLSDWFVVEQQRGRGIGRALLEAVLAEWRLRGGHQVMVELGYAATAARGLVERVGFAEKGRWFVIDPLVVRGIVPSDGVEVRQIEHRDFEVVTRLLAELGRPAPGEERLDALRRTFTEHVGRADTGSLLALLDGTPLGFCSFEMRRRLHRAEPEGWIPDLVVTETARGHGVGAVLLDAAFAEAERRGAHTATLESGFQRAVAHRLYASAGMKDVGSFYTLQRPSRR